MSALTGFPCAFRLHPPSLYFGATCLIPASQVGATGGVATPTLSPEERENPAPRLSNFQRLDWSDG
jgi:hypothetical protein